jgi:hypothetical protein
MMGPPAPQDLMMQVDPAEAERRRLMMQQSGMQPPQQPQLQPPAPPQQPMPPDATLGQVNQVANGPSNIEQIFQQAQQLAARAYAPALRQPKGGEQKGLAWHLGNAASFGMMGLAEHDYNAKYNQIVEHDNQAIKLHAAKEAFDLTKEAAGIGQMGLKQQLAMANFQARLAGLNLQQQRFELDKLRAEMGLEEATSSPMPTAEQADTAEKLYGKKWTPNPLLGGSKGKWTDKGAGSYAAPGSPAAAALGGETMTPGALVEERAQKKNTAAAQGQREKVRATQTDEVLSNIGQVRSFLNDPEFEKATSLLPSAGGSGIAGIAKRQVAGPAYMALGSVKGDPRAAFLQSANRTIIPMVRVDAMGTKGMRINLAEISLLGDQLKKLGEGKMTQEEAKAFRARANNWLDTIEKRVKVAPQEEGAGATSTPSTTPSAPSGITPGGVKYRVIP